MKKFSALLFSLALLTASGAHAQSSSTQAPMKKNTASNDEFAWGIGLGALAVLGAIVGLTASSAASTPPTYSNTSANH